MSEKQLRGYSLIELSIVFGVIAVLAMAVFFGIGNSRRDESVRADYLNFYDQLKSLKLRANLGKQTSSGSSIQRLSIFLGLSTYSINGVSYSLANKSVFRSIEYQGVTYSSLGLDVSLIFYPNGYSGTESIYGSCAGCAGGVNFNQNLKINISHDSTSSVIYPIIISASGRTIEVINLSSP